MLTYVKYSVRTFHIYTIHRENKWVFSWFFFFFFKSPGISFISYPTKSFCVWRHSFMVDSSWVRGSLIRILIQPGAILNRRKSFFTQNLLTSLTSILPMCHGQSKISLVCYNDALYLIVSNTKK